MTQKSETFSALVGHSEDVYGGPRGEKYCVLQRTHKGTCCDMSTWGVLQQAKPQLDKNSFRFVYLGRNNHLQCHEMRRAAEWSEGVHCELWLNMNQQKYDGATNINT